MKPRWPRRRRAFAHHDHVFAAMGLNPGKIVMVMHLVGRLRAENLQHLAHHEIAAGIRIAPDQRHGLPVGLAQVGLER